MAMKKRSRKQRKRKQSTRHGAKAIHVKQRGARNPDDAEHRSSPWLRILPESIENDRPRNSARGFFSQRNGRREPQGLNLSLRDGDLQSRRESH